MNSEQFIKSYPEIKFSEAQFILEQHGLDMDVFANEHPEASREGDAFIWINTKTLFDWMGY